MQYWEMGLPAYQIQTYQDAPLIMKSTYINEKTQICSSNWNTSELSRKKSRKSKKTY